MTRLVPSVGPMGRPETSATLDLHSLETACAAPGSKDSFRRLLYLPDKILERLLSALCDLRGPSRSPDKSRNFDTSSLRQPDVYAKSRLIDSEEFIQFQRLKT